MFLKQCLFDDDSCQCILPSRKIEVRAKYLTKVDPEKEMHGALAFQRAAKDHSARQATGPLAVPQRHATNGNSTRRENSGKVTMKLKVSMNTGLPKSETRKVLPFGPWKGPVLWLHP